MPGVTMSFMRLIVMVAPVVLIGHVIYLTAVSALDQPRWRGIRVIGTQ